MRIQKTHNPPGGGEEYNIGLKYLPWHWACGYQHCIRILILEIFNIFLWLKSSCALILNKIEHFSKVSSICVRSKVKAQSTCPSKIKFRASFLSCFSSIFRARYNSSYWPSKASSDAIRSNRGRGQLCKLIVYLLNGLDRGFYRFSHNFSAISLVIPACLHIACSGSDLSKALI